MDEVLVWTIALVLAAFGFILLAVAGAAAIILRLRRNGQLEIPTSTHIAEVGSDEKDVRAKVFEDAPDDTHDVEPSSGSGLWAWTKAWAFASVHALLVSLILGAVTFFEDLARANDEIQRTGTVKFPDQLLPGTITSSAARRRLSRAKGDYARYEAADDRFADLDEAGFPLPDGSEWRVVSLAGEMDEDTDGFVEMPSARR